MLAVGNQKEDGTKEEGEGGRERGKMAEDDVEPRVPLPRMPRRLRDEEDETGSREAECEEEQPLFSDADCILQHPFSICNSGHWIKNSCNN